MCGLFYLCFHAFGLLFSGNADVLKRISMISASCVFIFNICSDFMNRPKNLLQVNIISSLSEVSFSNYDELEKHHHQLFYNGLIEMLECYAGPQGCMCCKVQMS